MVRDHRPDRRRDRHRLGLLTQPGRNSSVDAAAQTDPGTTGSWFGFLNGLVPQNILGLQGSAEGALSFNVLQLIPGHGDA